MGFGGRFGLNRINPKYFGPIGEGKSSDVDVG